MKVPFAVYADLKCFTEKLDNVRPSQDSQYTLKYQKHEPSRFCFLIVSPYFEFELVIYTKKSEDEDIRRIFCETLETKAREVCDMIKYPKKMIFTEDDKRKYKESRKGFSEVRDHCHISGGAAHVTTKRNILVSRRTSRWIRYQLRETRSVLTMRSAFWTVLSSWLVPVRTLLNNLDKDNCKNLGKFNDEDKFELLKRRGVYPNNYVDLIENLDKEKLPSKDEFYSQLNDTEVSDEDYQHAQNVWN